LSSAVVQVEVEMQKYILYYGKKGCCILMFQFMKSGK